VTGGGVPLPPVCLLDGTQQGQPTGADGRYRFDLVPGAAPACPLAETNYAIAITEPAGYQPAPSTVIAPQGSPLDPTGGPNPFQVVANNNAPAGGDPTTYYLSFALESGDPDIINNHLPLDSLVTAGDILLSKSATKREASIGDMVHYTLTAENASGNALTGITLSDRIPAGFKYVKDSGRVIRAGSDGELGTADDIVTGIKPVGARPVEFINLDFAANETLEVTYLLRVGSGVVEGDYINRATPLANGAAVGNTASARVRVVADPIFDKTTIIGKVFHDRDGDGWQDSANAGEVVITASVDKVAYIPGSTRLESGNSKRVLDDHGGVPLSAGIVAGDLPGRSSVADIPENHRLVLRVGLHSHVVPDVEISTAEGTRIRLDADGVQHVEHTGDKQRGMTGQDLVVQQRVVPAETGYDLVITLTNYGVQEEGIPGVRLATVSGLLVETDAQGRYHIADVDAGRMERGRNFILKADPATLPPASEFTTENPRVIRITGGLMNRINFGVRLPDQALPEKTVRVRVGEVFFETGSAEIRSGYRATVEKMAEAIRRYRCGVITIEGHTDTRGSRTYNQALGLRRAESVEQALRKLLGDALMQEVEIQVQPVTNAHDGGIPEQQSNITPSGNRLWGYLLDLLASPAHAGEGEPCVATACTETPGVVIEVISRGELAPRSDNSTAAGRHDNRRTDVSYSGRMYLRDGGVIWATEDPAVIEPHLDVVGPAVAGVRNGLFMQPAVFRMYTNYNAFFGRWELGVYRASDTDFVNPVKTFTGEQIDIEGRLEWDGSIDTGVMLQAGDELVYRLRVFDADGRSDTTAVRSLYVSEPETVTPLVPASGTEGQVIYGRNSLHRQTIPLSGSRVRLHGADIPADYSLTIDGETVPVDTAGKFAVERLLPPGDHTLDVVITDAAGGTWQRPFSVPVSGEYLFMVGLADVTVGQNNVSGSVKPLEADDHFNENVFVDGRLAFYLKGKVQGKYLVTAQLDTTEDELDDIFSDLNKKDPRSLFRRLDPDRYYPVYGDDSTTISDVDTQGRFYVRVDWDKSQLLWGNYNTGITGNEYARYDRSLYGARLTHRSVDTTRFGDHRAEVIAFGSEPNTSFAHNEFIGTGGSLYYLRNTDVVQGSEKAWVEIRERDTNRVLENITLERGRDYEMDEIQGRL
ncbi:MAG: OmpA family protein, partial [Gammaproteobacteria bacterium]|nr:OmpA family protein [Gammaproteobacteria bacterium]